MGQRRLKILGLSILALLLVAGTLYAYVVERDRWLQQGYEQVHLSSTKEDVLHLMGQPSDTFSGSQLYSEHWRYFGIFSGVYHVSFDRQGRVLYKTFDTWRPSRLINIKTIEPDAR